MSKAKRASESALAELHNAVAKVLTDQVQYTEPETQIDGEGNFVETGGEVYSASPATLATAIKFLKDNQITCDIEQDENMGSLREALSKKQRHSRLKDADLAAQSMNDMH
jgi:hypothetical protein